MSVPIDYKKTERTLYQAGTNPSVVDVPQMLFIAVDGKGDPNTSTEYAAAIELLYGLSYGIKMSSKSIMEYVVPPLEGFWNIGGDFRGEGAAIADKSTFVWTMVIRQPEFVTPQAFDAAKAALAKKNPRLDSSRARLEAFTEGRCVQVLHVGSYDDEPATVALLDRFAADQGYSIDISATRRHHEIYLSDPRKVAPEKLRTILRHPVRRP
ncbi:MAG TPA: GyrI-like domain-containing protein [Candidatus Cryosericum sp.]|nr:GyrI-like domain-containing protein [Candidatus Cryosericum sp.]